MQNLFDKEGHITDQAFSLLVNEESALDELSRLELAEHLDFCDRCVERYSDCLTEAALIAPQEEIAPTVRERIRRRIRLIWMNRFTRVSAAACLAIVIWIGGIFQGNVVASTQSFAERSFSRGASFQQTMSDVKKGINDFFSSFNAYVRGDQFGK